MTLLRRCMIEDITLAGVSSGTQQDYLHAVTAFAQQFGNSPEFIEEEHVRIYLLNLREVKKWRWEHFKSTTAR